MLTDQAFVGLLELSLRLDDQKEVIFCLRDNSVCDGPRDIDVISLFERQRTEVSFDRPLAPVDEIQFIAIRIAEIERHRLGSS